MRLKHYKLLNKIVMKLLCKPEMLLGHIYSVSTVNKHVTKNNGWWYTALWWLWTV